MPKNMTDIYQKNKSEFLDKATIDDLINGNNFNQLGEIIDRINVSYANHKINQSDPDEFIKSAAQGLFRENSSAIQKLIDLAEIFSNSKNDNKS
ncbi:MAG: hypothetical protein ACI9TO_001214 [Rickettsiales bacterium]|jgi:hypothetical protein